MSDDSKDKAEDKDKDKKFDPGEIALKWWQALQPQSDKDGKTTSRGDPGALARLRRATSPVDALTQAQAIRLARWLGVGLEDEQRLARVGALAHVLAHVKTNNSTQHMARQLGPDKNGENAVMSSLRFQRLMAARAPEDLMREMRSAVKLLKGSANIADIADAFYWWSDKTRIRWTYHYWGAGDAAPDSSAKKLETTNPTTNTPNNSQS